MELAAVHIRTLVPPALARMYPGQQPQHFGCAGDTLVSAFIHPAGHLHYVTSGLRPTELSIRVASAATSSWPARLLAQFARIASTSPLRPGHYLCLAQPVDPEGTVRCGAVVPDPELGRGCLQIVGLCEDELAHIAGDRHACLVRALRRADPFLVTRPGRSPVDVD